MEKFRNLKKANLFAFSILILSGLFSFSLHNSNFSFDKNDKKIQSTGAIIDFEAGEEFFGATVDIDLDGYADTLYMWGNNDYGQIGNGASGSNVLIPVIIEPTDGWNGNIIDLSLGTYNSGVTVDTDLDGFADTLYVWGRNTSGEVGNGDSSSDFISKPTKIKDQSFWNGDLLDLNFGGYHSGILVDTNSDNLGDKLYMWGENQYGQLGLGDTKNIDIPTLVNFSFSKIIDFDLGYDFSGLISDTDNDNIGDTLYMWGHNNHDQLGLINSNNNYFIPTKVNSGPANPSWSSNGNQSDLLRIGLGFDSSFILADSDDNQTLDTLWSWGYNVDHQIDISTFTIPQPVASSDFNGDSGNYVGTIINASIGKTHLGVIFDSDADGIGDKAFVRGGNSDGQVGNNNTSDQLQYIDIPFKDDLGNPVNDNFMSLAFGGNNSGLLADLDGDGYNDTIYTWGNNDSGQIGNGTFGIDIKAPYLAFNLIPLGISSIDILALDDQNISITLILNDAVNIYNETNIPEIKLKDSDGDNLIPVIDEPNSDFASDVYVYTLSGLNPGTEYDFNLLTINDLYEFKISENAITDYLISEATLNSVTESTATFDLDLSQNNDFNFSNFDDLQRQVRINFDDSTSFETMINANDQIVIDGLNSSTAYNIASIDYNFDQNSSDYKYNILTPDLAFQTADFDLILEADTFVIDDLSITTSSFTYMININNLDEDEVNGGFTNFNPQNGLYLIDDSYNSYQTTYIQDSEVKIGDGEEQGTFEYQFSFQINNLSSGRAYDFIGVSFTNPFSQDDPSIITFGNSIVVNTVAEKNNLIYLWVLIALIIIFFIIILAVMFVSFSLKKRNLKMMNALNNISNKN